MDPQQIVPTLLALLPSEASMLLALDGLEESRDVLAFLEGYAFTAQYLREAGAGEDVVVKTAAVLRMLPRDSWQPTDTYARIFLPPAAAVMLSQISPLALAPFPPLPPQIADMEPADAEMLEFGAASLAAEPPHKNPREARGPNASGELTDEDFEENMAESQAFDEPDVAAEMESADVSAESCPRRQLGTCLIIPERVPWGSSQLERGGKARGLQRT